MGHPTHKSMWSWLFGKRSHDRTEKNASSEPTASSAPPKLKLDSSVRAPSDTLLPQHAIQAAVPKAPPSITPAKLPSSLDDYRYLLDELPEPGDLRGLISKVKEIATVSGNQRKAGDKLEKDPEGLTPAKARWALALELNGKAMDVVKRYKSYDLMFSEEGRPLPAARNSNYPLEGGEQELADLFRDLCGRNGGLLRRLGRGDEALAFYSIGADIERAGSDFGVANSYCTMNAISMQIELGHKRASPSSDPPPDIASDISKAREMIERQFEEGRDKDMWAKADLGLAFLLSGQSEQNREEARTQYYEFATGADADAFETSMRILRLIELQLRTINDPVAAMLTEGIAYLQETRQRKLEELREKGN